MRALKPASQKLSRGHAKTLRISILIITLSTFLVGVIPSYEKIGLTTPVLFILLRLIQGVSIGGEYSGIAFYYNLGNALFGGSTPLVVTLLTEKIGLITQAYYLIFMATITLITART